MWRDQLKTGASFRGVPFATVETEARVGRRGVLHEYAARDLPFVEDLGRRARMFAVEAYVVGDDYMDQRNALMTAIEEEGPGELVHPRWGTLQVSIIEYVTVRESPREGGIAHFQITFVESGENTFPQAVEGTVSEVEGACAELDEVSVEAFEEDFSVLGGSVLFDEGLLSFAADLTDLTSVVQQVMDASGASQLLDLVGGVVADLSTLLTLPGELAQRFCDLHFELCIGAELPLATFGMFRTAFHANPRPEAVLLAAALPGSTRQRLLVNDTGRRDLRRRLALTTQARALTIALQAPDLVDARPAVAVTGTSSGTGTRSGTGTSSGTGRKVRRREPIIATAAKAVQLRDVLLTQIDVELEDNDAPAPVATALVRLRRALTKDVAQRAEMSRQTSTFTPAAVLPSLVLAQRIYADGDRAEELELRNGVRHPGFVPATPLEILR